MAQKQTKRRLSLEHVATILEFTFDNGNGEIAKFSSAVNGLENKAKLRRRSLLFIFAGDTKNENYTTLSIFHKNG